MRDLEEVPLSEPADNSGGGRIGKGARSWVFFAVVQSAGTSGVGIGGVSVDFFGVADLKSVILL